MLEKLIDGMVPACQGGKNFSLKQRCSLFIFGTSGRDRSLKIKCVKKPSSSTKMFKSFRNDHSMSSIPLEYEHHKSDLYKFIVQKLMSSP